MLTEEDLKDLYKYIGDTLSAIFKEATKGQKDTKSPALSQEAEEQLKALRAVQKRLSGVCYYDPTTFQMILEADNLEGERLLLDPDIDNMLLHVNDKDIVSQTIVKWRFERSK